MSFISALHSGCMFLKQDILYAGAVKKLNLETFSVLCNKTLTSSKHCLCIICVYTEALIAVQSLFVIPLKMSSPVVVVEKCVHNKISSSISSTAVYLTHTVHWASLSTSVDSSRWMLEALFDFENAVICRSISMSVGSIRPMNSIIQQRNLFQFT